MSEEETDSKLFLIYPSELALKTFINVMYQNKVQF